MHFSVLFVSVIYLLITFLPNFCRLEYYRLVCYLQSCFALYFQIYCQLEESELPSTETDTWMLFDFRRVKSVCFSNCVICMMSTYGKLSDSFDFLHEFPTWLQLYFFHVIQVHMVSSKVAKHSLERITWVLCDYYSEVCGSTSLWNIHDKKTIPCDRGLC